MSQSRPFFRREHAYGSLRLALLPTLVVGALVRPAHGAEYLAVLDPASPSAVTFDDGFLSSGGTKVDLSRFERANAAMPGTYRADVNLNKEWRARTDIALIDVPGADAAQPCFDAASLTAYGVDLDRVADAVAQPGAGIKPIPEAERFCGPLGDYIPGASAEFDVATQALDITVPQLYTTAEAKGYVDPKYWDAGINAGAINYSANLYRNSNSGVQGRISGYVGVDASANFGSWHLVHRSSFHWTEREGRDYTTNANYLQHDIPALKSQIYVGDFYTSGRLFDAVNLRGASLESDDRMLPQSLRGYAPTVRGIAETNARVVIRQRGALLRELTVAPGPFEVSDLYPTGYGGDLDVEVIEADGRTKRFIIPFAATPQSLRAGQSRWEVSAGKVRQFGKKNTPMAFQATYQRGLNDIVTAYGGAAFATGYKAALAGGALNTRVGAFSVDVTGTQASLPRNGDRSGASVRVAYSKSLVDTGTNFSLAAYRYSTSGYVSLNDLAYLRNEIAEGQSEPFGYGRARSQLSATINQQLGAGRGQLYFNGARRDFWDEKREQVDFTLGYSNQWKLLSYSVSAQRTLETSSNVRIPGGSAGNLPGIRENASRRDTRFLLSASLPLGTGSNTPYVNAWLERSTLAPASAQIGVSGTALKEKQLNYNVTLARGAGRTSFNASTQYNASYGSLNASYSQGSGYKQVSAGINGGLVLHGGGHTWSPTLGETLGLIHAPGATGATVGWGRRSRVDSNGYAVVTNLVPYQQNHVVLDPKGTGLDVELKETSKYVAPRARSVVKLDFEARSGKAILIEGTIRGGDPIPFGAEIYDEQGNSVGVAGQGGQAVVRGISDASHLMVRWGDKPTDMCRIDLSVSANDPANGFDRYQVTCSQ